MSFDFSFRSASDSERGGAPFRIGILGDFGGQTLDEESQRSVPRLIDCDNFDEVFARIGVTLDLPPCQGGDRELNLRFQGLEDFHPDRLTHHLEPLARLARLRAELLSPATADKAATELGELLNVSVPPAEPVSVGSAESTQDLLTRLLGKPAAEPYKASLAGVVDRLIRQAIGSNVSSAPPRQPQLVRLVEAKLSACLGSLLHHPAFQALEAAWRGLDLLVRNTGEEVKLYLMNCSKSELATVLAREDWAKSVIYRQLEDIAPSVVLGLYTFGPQDHAVLTAIARLADACKTAFVAGASPQLVGCHSFGVQPDPDDWTKGSSDEMEGFEAVRRMPEAAHLGLTMPRFLLRQPYGEGSETIEAFPFEEMSTNPEHECYLWGNPAFLCGYLLAEAFATQGSDPEVQAGGEVGGLPVHTFTSGGETQVKPCAEAWLNERAAGAILSHGIMPVLSIRGRDAVQLLTLRSLSNPPRPLAVRLGFES